jgi:hypothetical protein
MSPEFMVLEFLCIANPGRKTMSLTSPAEMIRTGAPVTPSIVFLGAVLIAVAVGTLMPKGLGFVGLAFALFTAAALAAALSWALREASGPRHITYWDVAGALTFVGICAAALVQPEQLVGIAESTPRRD